MGAQQGSSGRSRCHLWRNSILKGLLKSYRAWLSASSWPFSRSSGPDAGKQEPSAKGLATSNQLNPKNCRGQTWKKTQNTFFCCLFVLFHSHKKRLFLWTGYKSHPQEELITLKNLGKIKPPWLGASWPRILIWLFFPLFLLKDNK